MILLNKQGDVIVENLIVLKTKLNEDYRKPAYKELIKELTEKLNNIPKEIERMQIEYFKKCLVTFDSYYTDKDKEKIIQEIAELKQNEIELKELIQQLKETYDSLYEDKNENKIKVISKAEIRNLLINHKHQ